MRYRQLGSSDLQVSEISPRLVAHVRRRRGARPGRRLRRRRPSRSGSTSSTPPTSTAAARPRSFLGEVLGRRPRDSYVLATKLFFPMAPTRPAASRARRSSSSSTPRSQRLRTDYVDLYQCHRYDCRHAARGDDGGAHRGRAAGQGALHRLQRVAAGADRGRRSRSPTSSASSPASRSTRCSGAARSARSSRSAPSNGISQIVWSPLAQGVLTGKYTPGEPPPADSRAASDEHGRLRFDDRLRTDSCWRRCSSSSRSRTRLGCTLAQLALAWVLREPNVASAIVGATRPEQVEDNAAASGVELDGRDARAHRRDPRRPRRLGRAGELGHDFAGVQDPGGSKSSLMPR